MRVSFYAEPTRENAIAIKKEKGDRYCEMRSPFDM